MTETSFVLNKNMRNFGDAHEKLNFVDSNWQVRLYLYSLVLIQSHTLGLVSNDIGRHDCSLL